MTLNRPLASFEANGYCDPNYLDSSAQRKILEENLAMSEICPDILDFTDMHNVIKVCILGNTMTGKLTLASLLTHYLHEPSNKPFNVQKLGYVDIMKKSPDEILTNSDNVIILKNSIFIHSNPGSVNITELNNKLTELRDFALKQKNNVFLIFLLESIKGYENYLDNTDFLIFTGLGLPTKINVEKYANPGFLNKLEIFANTLKSIEDQIIIQHMTKKSKPIKFMVSLGNSKTAYYYPEFRPALVCGKSLARIIAYPQNSISNQKCSTCEVNNG